MHDIINIPAIQIMIGTLPVTALLTLTLLDQKNFRSEIRAELLAIRAELKEIRLELARHGERLATLEERDRWEHPVVKP